MTLAVGGMLIWWIDAEALWQAVHRAQWTWAVLALALVPLNVGLDAWVWRILLRPILGAVSLRAVTSAVLAGCAAGFFTPARVGEYAGRSFALEADGWTLTVSVLVQRMADMAVGILGGAGAVGLLMAFDVLPTGLPWRMAWIGGALVGLGLMALLLGPAAADAWGRRWLPTATRLHERTAFLRRLTRSDVRWVLGGSLVRYAVYIGQFRMLSRAFAPATSLLTLGLLGSALFFIKFLAPSLTLMDLGIREGTAAVLFPLVGLPAAAGLHAALLLFVLNVALPSALGAPAAWNLLSTPSVPASPPSSASKVASP